MGTMNMDTLPGWSVAAGCMLIALMAAGMICCIARDITEMRVLWRAEEVGRKRPPAETDQGQKELRRRKKRGVNLEETRLERRTEPVAGGRSI